MPDRSPAACALGSALLLLAATAPAVRAQLPADSARRDSTRADSARPAPAALPAVRVTALGGSLAPSRVPYAVTVVVPAGAARLRAPLALDDALRGVPGLAVDNRYNIALGERITIRGFGARTQFGVRGVHVDVDGVPATMPDGQTTLSHVDPASIGSSEVLRGPASSLYGNAAGGVVRLTTLSPLQLGNDIRLSTSVAERGTVTTRGSMSGVAGGWGGEARISSLDYRGFRVHSDARDLRGGGQLVHAGNRDTLRLTLATVDYDADNPGGLTDSASVAAPHTASATNLRYRTGEKGSHRQTGIAWRRSLASWSLDASGWGLSRHLVNPIPLRIIDLKRRAAGARLAIEHGGADDRVALGAGIEHGSQWDDRRSFSSQDGVRGAIALDQNERVASDGAFMRTALALASSVTALASLRADRITFSVDDDLVTATNPDDGGSRTMSALSPSVGVAWVLTPRFSTYANVATAFETPTTTELANRPNGAGGMNPDLAPQHVVATEAGVRAPLGSFGSATFALFDARIRDALVPFEVPTAPGRQFYRNASRARQSGVEAGATALLRSWALARVAATLVNARFAATDSAAGLVAGRRIPGVAPFRTDVSLTAGAGGPLRAELLATTQSRTPANDANTAWAPGFTVVDVNAGLVPRGVGGVVVSASASLSNVFNRRYDTSVVPNAARGRFFEPGPGRTLTLTLELSRHRGSR
ncbi:MAG TPA: TonB-dependent receptor [Gemmatimonadaceae bacterium]|nr:TonB-dependent receptor [Gemmatimonadaceae bacterium]